MLLGVTVLLGVLTLDKHVSRADAVVLLVVLLVLIVWSIVQARRAADDELGKEVEAEAAAHPLTRKAAWGWLIAGLVLLVVSSRVLVWGAVAIAKGLGWSDLVIGLTVVALGTSAPELASSIAAARKGENDLALGNVIGSNLFNTLGVIGLAGVISPAAISTDLVVRDIPVVFLFATALVVFALWPLGRGRVTRVEGLLLVAAYVTYMTVVFVSA